jgi:hypothetical protein
MELDEDVDEWNGMQALHVLGHELDEDKHSHGRSGVESMCKERLCVG